MASSSGSLIPRYNHDVFLSFRGEDTRTGFTYNMYKALERENIKTFFDDHKLKRGEDIAAALRKAIEVSNISVVICSENYGSSSWCLDELVKILECQKSKGQIVIPVFYKVNPAEVRHQIGRFGEVFADLTHKSYNQEMNTKWKEALTQVTNFSGWTYKEGYESDFIEKIVNEIKFGIYSNGAEDNIDQSFPEVEKNVDYMDQLYNRALLEAQRTGVYNQDFLNKIINSMELIAGVENKENFRFPSSTPQEPSESKNSLSFVAHKCDLTCPPCGEDKVVLYTTSFRGVRKTFSECNEVRSALKILGVAVCERDLSMDRRYREELSGLMKGEVVVPKLFVRGKCVGGYDDVMGLVEDGLMEDIVEGYV